MPLIFRSKWFVVAALTLGLAACGSGGDDNLTVLTPTTVQLKAALSGDQEVPFALTGALGTGSLSLESSLRAVSGS